MAGEEQPPRKDAPEEEEEKKGPADNSDLWRLLGSGIQLAVTVALFAALGAWLESKFGWPAWSRTAVSIFGIFAALYFFVKETPH